MAASSRGGPTQRGSEQSNYGQLSGNHNNLAVQDNAHMPTTPSTGFAGRPESSATRAAATLNDSGRSWIDNMPAPDDNDSSPEPNIPCSSTGRITPRRAARIGDFQTTPLQADPSPAAGPTPGFNLDLFDSPGPLPSIPGQYNYRDYLNNRISRLQGGMLPTMQRPASPPPQQRQPLDPQVTFNYVDRAGNRLDYTSAARARTVLEGYRPYRHYRELEAFDMMDWSDTCNEW